MPFAVALSLVLSLGTLQTPMPPPGAFPVQPPPTVDARAWMAWSVAADAEIGSLNPDQRLAFASITKLLTAIIVTENSELTEASVISGAAAATPIGYVGQPAIRQGETWSVGQLLEMMMVQSSNDAAVALAEHVAGTTTAFVALMNERAQSIGMVGSQFQNPNGLDAVDHHSTARDLVHLGMEALLHPEVMDVVRVKQVTFRVGGRELAITATNRDLGVYPGFLGLRTGDTLTAGQTLLAYVEAPGGDIIAVILGSTNRRAASREILAWAARALGPADYLLATAAHSQAGDELPGWYRTRLAAAAALLPLGEPDASRTSPLRLDLQARLSELLPDVLGGDR